MIEDWEIGALYWKCLVQAEGDEVEANRLVRKKYFDEFLTKKDIYLFVGTTKRYHAMNAPNCDHWCVLSAEEERFRPTEPIPLN